MSNKNKTNGDNGTAKYLCIYCKFFVFFLNDKNVLISANFSGPVHNITTEMRRRMISLKQQNNKQNSNIRNNNRQITSASAAHHYNRSHARSLLRYSRRSKRTTRRTDIVRALCSSRTEYNNFITIIITGY